MQESSHWPASDGERLLQDIYGSTERATRFYNEQMVDVLTERMRNFLACQTWMILCTADEDGMPSGSPRFGEPGFVVPIDDRTVTWPEMRGNGVMTSLGNLVKNPKAHLMFPDLTERIGLHLRGETTIVEHDVMRVEQPAIVASVKTPRQPERWVILRLEVGYVHCRKHFPRSDDKRVDWGTDDVKAKGGDYFGARDVPKPWRRPDQE
jgi:predicted pyridoxine 5'-phosphate oxidase superfamily flavin-nucleotide-binding protein